MKKFIINTTLFLLPFAICILSTDLFYSKTEGDLTRIGYLPKNTEYRKQFSEAFNSPIYYDSLINWKAFNANAKGKRVLIFGDSFSEVANSGYKNSLAKDPSINVIYDKPLFFYNPFQRCIDYLNGDFTDSLKVNYIILQSVERKIGERVKNIEYNTSKKIADYKRDIFDKGYKKNKIQDNGFLSLDHLKFPLYNFLYLFNDHAFISNVYRKPVKGNYFSNNKKEVLFYSEDLLYQKINNRPETITNLKKTLISISKKCKEKNIKLIFLVAPDKYSFYNEENIHGSDFLYNVFNLKIEDVQIPNTYKILKDSGKKDIYLWDDTHWLEINYSFY